MPCPPHRRSSPRLAVALAWPLAVVLMLASCGPNPEKASRYETMADQMMDNKAWPAAIKTLKKAVDYNGNDPDLWVKLGRSWRALNNPALSAQSYQHALDLQPDNVEALEALAVLTVRAGDYDSAKRFVSQLLVLQPDDIAAVLAQGAIALNERRFDDALKASDHLIAIAPSFAEGYILKARTLDTMGRTPEAIQLLAQRANIDPGNIDTATQLLGLYQKTGNVDGVRTVSIQLAGLLPDDPRYQLESARAYHARGLDPQAQDILSTLATRYHGNPQVMQAIALYWRDTLPADQAQQQIVELAANASPRAKAAIADTLVRMGAAPAAVGMLAPVAAQPVNSGNVDMQAAYAQALYASGQIPAARAKAQEVIAFDPGNDVALIVQARDELARKDYIGALRDAQLVASDAPSNEDAALLVPQIYSAEGNDVMTAAAFGDSQQRLPNSIAVHRARMQWLMARKRYSDAAQIASLYTAGHPGSAEAWQLMADACQKANDIICLAKVRAHGKIS